MPGERKSVEPTAAVTARARVPPALQANCFSRARMAEVTIAVAKTGKPLPSRRFRAPERLPVGTALAIMFAMSLFRWSTIAIAARALF
jgi:hypothetical protein